MKKRLLASFYLIFAAVLVSGCEVRSYPADTLKEDLAKICRDEYGIKNIEVKFSGDTIGVFLPLEKLFAADFKDAAVTGKVRNLETLFEPSEEALERIEDVLFGISRVILSTDRDFKFYVLQATDVDKTGLQLVLSGYVDDIRRVRIWDISRDEYRKRIFHELRMNRAVKWHQPVKSFFKDVETLYASTIRDKYFSDILPVEAIQTIFLDKLKHGYPEESDLKWKILDIRSTPLQKGEVIVYVKVHPQEIGDVVAPEVEESESLMYLFTLSFTEDMARVRRIIPFQYKDENGALKRIPFPKELKIDENLDKWEQEFQLPDLQVGNFLADQITRRVQSILAMDERIQNTFRNIQLQFSYVKEPKPSHFSLTLEASLSDFNHYQRETMVFHEDMLYLLKLASREFMKVNQSYGFKDYENLSLYLSQEVVPFVLGREELELFRRNKVDLQGLLSSTAILKN